MIGALSVPEKIIVNNCAEAEVQLAAIDDSRTDLTDEEAMQSCFTLSGHCSGSVALTGRVGADAAMLLARRC